jgi:hypothetical protein
LPNIPSEVGGEHSDHDKFTVGEVYHSNNTKNSIEADGDDCVNAADENSRIKNCEEFQVNNPYAETSRRLSIVAP